MQNNQRKRFVSLMLLVLALAALVWALLRVYNTVQDHRASAQIAGTATA